MQQIVSIQYLRGFAALLVLVYHVGLLMPSTGLRFAMGGMGVDIFFVISGFIIWITGRDLTPAEFLKRRILRLAPLYWTVTILVAAGIWATGGAVGWSELAHSMAFVAHPPGDTGLPPKPILSVGWTLNLEILFYALMAGVLFAPRAIRLPLIVGLLGGLVTFGTLLPANADPRLSFYTGLFFAEFLIGILFGVLWTSGRVPDLSSRNVLIFAGATLALAALPLDGANRLMAYGGFVILLVLLALMAEPGLRARPSGMFHVLGDASYSLYLTHLPVIFACQMLVAQGVLPQGGPVLAVIAITAALVVSHACHLLFERPVHRALSARLRGDIGRAYA